MFRRFALMAVICSLALSGLSGCLVSQKESKTYQSGTDTLRIYQANDFISYRVTQIQPSPASGTMTVQWDAAPTFAYPQTPTSPLANILKETTTLTIGDDTSVFVRYISQERDDPATLGTIRVHAYESPVGPKKYYLAPETSADTPSAVDALQSPLLITTAINVDYAIYDESDCLAGVCGTAISRILEQYMVVSERATQTDLTVGRFFTSQVDIVTATVQASGTALVIPTDFNLPAFCAAGSVATNYRGNLYLFPEVGVLRYDLFCGTSWLEMRMTGTNIPLPPPV